MKILAIDDDPGRYDHLSRLLENRGITLNIACCAECIARMLPDASAVLLDYDLDREPACSCGQPKSQYPPKSPVYVPLIAEREIPVIVTSSSSNANVTSLCAALRAANVQYGQYRAGDVEPEDNWIGKLWRMGVL